MNKTDKIYIAGHRGMVGSALLSRLEADGYTNLVYRTSQELDLRRQKDVEDFFEKEKPDYVFLIAARVGGIQANINYPAEFLIDNLQIQSNVIDSAYKSGCKKLLFLASSCVYPRECPQPMKEEYLMTGPLEPTNESYAMAKLAGVKLCQAYRQQYGFDAICAMPCNLYGPGDNFHPENSHVVAGMIRRLHEAKISGAESVTIWGTGTPRRELLYVDDLADALFFLMNNYSKYDPINVGAGYDISIMALAHEIAQCIGFRGLINSDLSMPDGMHQKLLSTEKMKSLGWKSKINLREGLIKTYNWFVKNK